VSLPLLKIILALGHSRCGAITMKPGIEATVNKGGADLVAAATIANVRYNVRHVK
jgi:hypothetical protein